MSMRARAWECVFRCMFVCECHCECACVCFFSIHSSPRSHQKTNTTAAKGIIPWGNGREKLPIMQTQTHTHLVMMLIQILPHSRQRLVHSLLRWISYINKNIHTEFARTSALTDLCVCVRSLSALFFSTILTLFIFCVFSLPLTPTRLFRWGADITHLLVPRRQMKKDYSASSIFIQQLRPFSAGKLSPLLETQHKSSTNSSNGQTA